jgi:hypothetical protein
MVSAYSFTSSALGANIRIASQIQAGAGDEAAQDAAGARFIERIGGDDDVGKLLGHKFSLRRRIC